MSDAILMKSGGMQFNIHCSASSQPTDKSLLWLMTNEPVTAVAVVYDKPASATAGTMYLIARDAGTLVKLVDELDTIEVKLVDAWLGKADGQFTNISASVHDGTTWTSINL